MIKVEFIYNLGDRVYIPELKRIGYVISLWYGETGKQYRVSYFDEGSKKTEYFSDREIILFENIESNGSIRSNEELLDRAEEASANIQPKAFGFKSNASFLKETDEKTKTVKPGKLEK